MDKFDHILLNIPSAWKDNNNSVLSKIIRAITDEMDVYDSTVNHVNNMIGINDVTGTDLDLRWGNLLGISRYIGESDDRYRDRLKTAISQLVGGTANVVRTTVYNILSGSSNPSVLIDDISVLDAWAYTGVVSVNKAYGNAICLINLSHVSVLNIDNVIDAINTVKAAGINFTILFYMNDEDETAIVGDDNDNISATQSIVPDDGSGAFDVGIDARDDDTSSIVDNDGDDNNGYPYNTYDVETAELITNGGGIINQSIVSPNDQYTIISIDEYGTDIIKKNGSADVVINY